MRPLRAFRGLFCLVILLTVFVFPVTAQTTQCGLATAISFPVDQTQFQLVQDFGAPSPRHQGRYHTGEDWYGGRGSSYGTYVHASANGQVTFSSPNGWGRDGGVIIIAHAFPDGTTAYSMYGHVTDATGVQFPAPFTCVKQGDVIAAVGAPRPAPHLHFEIRTQQPDIPGPGYTDQNPVDLGWRRPSKFVDNWQAWFLKSTLWHADIADETGPVAPPVELPDHSLLVLDAQRVLRISNDGRVLWRVNLDEPAVGLISQPSGVVVAFASGKMLMIAAESTVGESWQSGVAFDSPPMLAGSLIVFHAPDNRLIALSADGRSTAWQVSDVAPILRWAANDKALGLMTADNAMLTVSLDGRLNNLALLREPGSLAVSTGLLAYTRGGFWTVADDGTWTLTFPDAPPGGRNSAVAESEQHLYLFDGTALHAYDRSNNNAPLWTTPLPGVTGDSTLSVYDNDKEVLLTSNHGDITAVQVSSGGVCNTTRIYGSNRAREWHSLGDDGVLRIYVADQIIGLNWQKFLMACAQ
jgi:murein DD-endopeptidase MepM/ murein hydrolase activator NlpD